MFLPLALPLLDWARSRGAVVSPSVDLASGPNGRGLFAISDVAAGAELVTLPAELQLGVGQLAAGGDAELQQMIRGLPWRDVVSSGLTFLPCAISLAAEKRKGDASIFADYSAFLAETPYSNAIAPLLDGSCGDAIEDELLGTLAPATAAKVASRRQKVRAIHEQLAPASLPLGDLCWASACACSRSLTRRIVAPLTADETATIGEVAAADTSRLLPVIDLVNHGGRGGANADVKHLKDGTALPEYDPFSTSLIATRDIAAGDEVLLDYGAGAPVANEKLLLDYGFVLRPHAEDTLTMRVEDLLSALGALEGERGGMSDVPGDQVDALRQLIGAIANHAERKQGAAALFGANGAPSLPTLALALALSPRGPEDVARLLTAFASGLNDAGGFDSPAAFEEMLLALVKGSTDEQSQLALSMLSIAARMALSQVSEPEGEAAEDFDEMSRAYCSARYEMLMRVAERG